MSRRRVENVRGREEEEEVEQYISKNPLLSGNPLPYLTVAVGSS